MVSTFVSRTMATLWLAPGAVGLAMVVVTGMASPRMARPCHSDSDISFDEKENTQPASKELVLLVLLTLVIISTSNVATLRTMSQGRCKDWVH